jgi:hypothetical protein
MIKATGIILNGAPKAEIDSTISGHFLSGKNIIYLCTLLALFYIYFMTFLLCTFVVYIS